MLPLPTPEEMGRADRIAIDSGTSADVLMERAGRAVARAVVSEAGGRYGRRIAVVCGVGNNGGDGFVAARVLARNGFAVRTVVVGDRSKVAGAARHHLDLLLAAGGRLEPFTPPALVGVDVIVDALFGTGFRGRAEGEAAAAIEAINASPAPVVAADIPSGVAGLTGGVEGPAVNAAVTVAMGACKLGGAVGAGGLLSGRVDVADIGIPVAASSSMSEGADVGARLPGRPPDAHKRSLGAVALLAGSAGMSGAAMLAARGAVRAGAGYATVGLAAATDHPVSTRLPEVLSRVVTGDDALGPDALDGFEDVIERAGALGIGPGLGTGKLQAELVASVLERVEIPVVVDADALNVLAADPSPLIERSGRGRSTVLTPHPGELGRLLDRSATEIQANRTAAVTEAAGRFGCVVLLKGFRTLVSHGGRGVVVNPTGGPALATAGTGDVLTGVVTALAAAGLDPFDAAWCAAYIHGRAGEIAASTRGPAGVLAWDVAEALPAALAELT